MMTNKNGDLPTLMDLLNELDARKGVEVVKLRLPKELGRVKLQVLAVIYGDEE